MATPGLGSCMTPLRLRVPSGKMHSTSPRSNTARATRYASMSLPPALTGVAPSLRRIQPIGPTNSACLARMCICLPSMGVSQPATSGGSAFEMWLETTMSGPSRGISPSISTVTLAPRRSIVRESRPAKRSSSGTPLLGPSVIERFVLFRATDQGHDLAHGLLERVAGRIEDCRPLGYAQRAGGTRAVDLVALTQLGLDLGERVRIVGQTSFRGPPARALRDRHVEVQLEIGVGQHHRADVAPGHDEPPTC